jgi:hypothetical protein
MSRTEDMRRHIESCSRRTRGKTSMMGSRSPGFDGRTGRAPFGIWVTPYSNFSLRRSGSAISYATALHEIGHDRGRHQSSCDQMVRERWAWEWARRNALDWTPAMGHHAVKWLERVRVREEHRRAKVRAA